MRSGVSPPQQTLSPEAASVLKHSLSLSRRRGHAQVTPLHVAATLLNSRASLLGRACLKSQSSHHHPLQCRALELCFNVALNRLPTSPVPLFPPQPLLSNALTAALKRAQAHQRRGCAENQQQQPLIGLKVELDQLIMSILDDPSVSRVMREAGFSSTAVKNNLDDSSVSSVFQCYNNGGIYSTPSSPPDELARREIISPSNNFWHSRLLPFSLQEIKNPCLLSVNQNSFKEDIEIIIGVMLREKRRNIVIVGDNLSMVEGVSREFMTKLEKGDVPEGLKSAHFIKFQFSCVPIRLMKREEVEMNVADLKRKIDSFIAKSSNGGVIIYTGDLKWSVEEDEGRSNNCGYNAVDHLVAEIGKLLSLYDENDNARLLRVRVWLMGVATYQTYNKCQMKQIPLDVQWCLQAVTVPSGGLGLSLSASSGQGSRTLLTQNPSNFLGKKHNEVAILTCCPECKWNYEKEAGIFQTGKMKSDHCSVQLPNWLQPHSILEKEELVQLRMKYNDLCQALHQGRNYFPSNLGWPNKNKFIADSGTTSFAYSDQTVSTLPKFRRQQSCHINFSFSDRSTNHQAAGANLDSLKSTDDNEVKITLALGSSTHTDELLSERLNIVQDNVPWQSETIPLILKALMDSSESNKLLLIQGNDVVGKRRLALGIAESVFGSSDLLFCMNMRKNTNTPIGNVQMLRKTLRDHEKLVVLVEDADYADPEFLKFLEAENLDALRDDGHAIFILTVTEGTDCNDARNQNADFVIQMKLTVIKSSLKRKAEWDFPIMTKTQRGSNISSMSLDLNIKADESECKLVEEVIPMFLKKIKNRFVLNIDSDKDEQAREMFLSKIKKSFQQANENISSITNFSVDEMVLDEILKGSGVYLNKGFEEWLRDVFQTGLRVVDTGEKDTVSVRLDVEGKGGNCAEGGYMGTCLPKRIQVSFIG